MAACFSREALFKYPAIYVLTQMPGLTECLRNCATSYVNVSEDMPEVIAVNVVELPTKFNENILLTEAQLQEVRNAEIIVCDKHILANNYNKLPNARWVHCTSVGLEELFEAIPYEPRFRLTRHGGESIAAMMAEYVMCQILNHERRIKCHWKEQEDKKWKIRHKYETSRTLEDLTVGIMGVGHMGAGIAKFLKSRGTSLIGFARKPRSFFHRDKLFNRVTICFEEFLPHCDYIVNTLPSTPLTKGLLNNSVLKMCLKNPVFINVGRGDIICEDELELALRNQWISAAVLDVFEKEPMQKCSRLLKMPQVTITPHVAAATRPEQVAREFFRILCSYYEGNIRENYVLWFAGY